MDKQKQIEVGISMVDLLNQEIEELRAKQIPEGSVLLTAEQFSDYLETKNNYANAREKCEKLQADIERLYRNIAKYKELVRKETAEKFAKSIKAKFAEISTCGLVEEPISVLNRYINKIAKEITEGV